MYILNFMGRALLGRPRFLFLDAIDFCWSELILKSPTIVVLSFSR